MKNVVSCGHKLSSQAALKTLKKGGNAFDALVTALFASSATEPMLTSLAGVGGALLRSPKNEIKYIDFLADYPSLGKKVKPIKKIVNFGDETQVFYLGYGSMAVPTNLPGMLYIQKKYGRLELRDVLKHVVPIAKAHVVNPFQAYTCSILKAFCVYTKESREVFAPKGRLLKGGEIIRNEKLADFIEFLAEDEKEAMKFYHRKLKETIAGKNSSFTFDEVKKYKVIERKPLSVSYRGYDIEMPPPPAAGGTLVAYALNLLEKENLSDYKHNSVEHIRLLAEAMKAAEKHRTKKFFKDILGGTTQVSIIDKEGNAASMTTSNGQGCGIMVKDTGIMLNNFASEPDLVQYKELYRPGKRMTTMMTPTIITKNGRLRILLGSGGSNRIRSAVLQAMSNIIDFKMPPEKSANASRVHYEAGLLQLEYGIKKKVCDKLSKEYKTNVWSGKNLFFGGVHIATPDGGAGDKRRAGYAIASG